MVNELRELMHDAVATPPHDDTDLALVLRTGRRRVRRRRRAAIGGVALATAAVVTVGVVAWPESSPDLVAAGVPQPDAPTIRLSDAETAVEGEDYRLLTSYTNENLDRDNGQYLDGVTDDGLVLFRDAPDRHDSSTRLALMDPATGEKDWIPDPPNGSDQLWPVDLGAEQLVLTGQDAEGGTDAMGNMRLYAVVYDRGAGEWRRVEWEGLPLSGRPWAGVLGPDGRLYVGVPATRGRPPAGGWPTDASGEADDADAEGDSFDLWSVSLTDPDDVRDEHLRVGYLDFTESQMVWTDRGNGDSGLVHVRDLATGEERSFDPRSGERCNLLSFGVSADRIVMGQYCGTYGDVRDDRVQILTTDGDQVVTIQGSGLDGGLEESGDVVGVTSYEPAGAGNYVYDLDSGRFLRLSEDVSKFGLEGAAGDGRFLWHTPVNRRHGATQWLGELID